MKESKALFDNDSADQGGTEDQGASSKSVAGPTLTLLETGQNPGAILKSARERLGLSVSEISLRTKINEKQLIAIESGDTSKFPPATFAKAFIKSYCKVVELDAAPILLAFGFESSSSVSSKVAVSVDQGAAAPRMPSNSRRLSSLSFDRRGGSRKFGLIAAIAVALVFAAFYLPEFLSDNETASSVESEQPAPSAVSEASSEPVSAVAEPTTEAGANLPAVDGMVSESIPLPAMSGGSVESAVASAVNNPSQNPNFVFPAIQEERAKTAAAASAKTPADSAAVPASTGTVQSQGSAETLKQGVPGSTVAASASSESAFSLRFVFAEESWVTVRDADNKVLMSQLNQSGSETILEGTAPFKLVVGNADSVRLFVNGRAFDLTDKTRGEVARLVIE